MNNASFAFCQCLITRIVITLLSAFSNLIISDHQADAFQLDSKQPIYLGDYIIQVIKFLVIYGPKFLRNIRFQKVEKEFILTPAKSPLLWTFIINFIQELSNKALKTSEFVSVYSFIDFSNDFFTDYK